MKHGAKAQSANGKGKGKRKKDIDVRKKTFCRAAVKSSRAKGKYANDELQNPNFKEMSCCFVNSELIIQNSTLFFLGR
jgi:hypothetical protein